MKREARIAQGHGGDWVPPDEPLLRGRPTLAQGLTDLWWEGGQPREPWTLTLGWSLGMVRASVNDKEECRSISSDGETVSKALSALEGALNMPQRPWRYWAKGKARK